MIHEWMGMWDAWTCEHRIQSILSDDKWIHGYVSMWPHIVYPMRWNVQCTGIWAIYPRK